MNIPAPSERTIRENIGKSSFTTGAEIQVLESTITCSSIDDNHFSLLPNYIKVMILFSKVLSIFCIYHLTQTAILDEAHKVHPNSQWWIKADGCDLVSGLGESVQQVWSGDVDLADGKVQKMHDAYLKRLRELSHITGDMSDLAERQLLIARLAKKGRT